MVDENLSDRRFTTSAQHIIQQMRPRAADRSMSELVNERTAPMLALWSLLRWGRKVGLVALETMSVNAELLTREVDEALSAACEAVRREQPQADLPGKKVVLVDFQPLDRIQFTAKSEAAKLGHDYVGTEHVLLAIIEAACPQLREILTSHAITHERARESILQLLRG